MPSLTDSLGQTIALRAVPKRVVSLVPSETEALFRLQRGHLLVGRTSFCIEPAGEVEDIPCVGGTKSIDVAGVLRLAPDLVLANKEENSEPLVRALIARGLRVHVSFPTNLEDTATYLETLGRLVDADERATLEAAALRAVAAWHPVARVWVPIWKDPWMSFSAGTYADALLKQAGLCNVFSERRRRYPLSADLQADSNARDVATERDTRYPRHRLEEALAQRPDLVLLPSEPFEFSDAHRVELSSWFPSDVTIVRFDGKDLFWYGPRTRSAIARLRSLLVGLGIAG